MTKLSLYVVWLLMALASVAQATEWSLTSTLNPSVKYNDNVFLSEDAQASMHYALTPNVTVSRADENAAASLSAGYQIDRYSSLSSDNDTENPFIRFNSSYNTERSQYGLSASYTEATSRSTALEDSGDFTSQAINRTRSISPSYRYQLSERDSLMLNGLYSERLSSTIDFSDTETRSMSAGWQRQFSERLSAGLTATIANYKSDNALNLSTDDDDYSLSTTFNYSWTELWDIGGSIGIRRLESERTTITTGLTESDNSTGSTFALSVMRTDDIDSYAFSLSRALTPSGTGDINESDRVSATWSRNFSDRLTANVVASYQQTTSVGLENFSEDRENINFSSSLRWQLESNLSLNFGYSYRKQSQDSRSSTDSNTVGVTLNYNWDGIRISR